MSFQGKSILLVSPQSWGKMQLSKQHYAELLTKLGAVVYYVNPPDIRITIRREYVLYKSKKNLVLIDYTVPFISRLKYRLFNIYSIVNRICLEGILRKENLEIDILWNFDNGLVSQNIIYRNAKINIFHPVDQLRVPINTSGYHFVFSLSNDILSGINHSQKIFINHGLGEVFAEYSKSILSRSLNPLRISPPNITCCYVGNLLASSIDRFNFIETIKYNDDFKFLLIGTYETSNNNLVQSEYLDVDSRDFINTLKSFSNVELVGPKDHYEIIDYWDKVDCFFLCYKTTDYYKCDNTHKILEYLCTGKLVVSTYIEAYEETDLFRMLDIDENVNLKYALRDSIINADEWLNMVEVNNRILFALSNTYKNNLDKIGAIIFS